MRNRAAHADVSRYHADVPTLVRKGYRVLVVDRATFPSDTISTHVGQPHGGAALNRWGLLEQFVATGMPAIDTYTFDFGSFTISGSPGTAESPVAYCPRRTVLEFAARIAAATCEARVIGMAVPNYFRKPYGHGWALVGDAGYNKDFITAQGISDAFRDAELCATALDETFSGARSFDDAMGEYHATRDQHVLAM
jgi:2-polyprenyl-6-methoxyphenol hydroxylase-like FAD-dependent oxidoreductase